MFSSDILNFDTQTEDMIGQETEQEQSYALGHHGYWSPFYQCTPKKCGRLILDGLLNQREIEILKNLASSGTMALGGGAGGASILELSGSTCSMYVRKF